LGSMKRLKKPWHGRGKGSLFPVRDEPLRVKDVLHSRPLYYMQGKEVHKGSFEHGKVVEGPAIDVKGDTRRGYETGQQTCMELTPSKLAQREELADKVDGGTILETHAGKGNLSANVYADAADKLVLVDKDKSLLSKADQKLNGKVKHETVVANNTDWLKDTLKPEELRNLKLVDFDPFGSPSGTMKAFFKRFPVRHKLLVGVTDGSKTYIGYKKGQAAHKWLKANYGIDLNAQGTREDQIRVLDSFMQVLGRYHGFTVKPINAGFGKQTAVYAGYELTPK
jgi:tRNA G26 N,N-dimethylase Trm1